jgi:DNA processing protein
VAAVSGLDLGTAYAAALAGLPGMTPVRLASLLAGHDPSQVWARLVGGEYQSQLHRSFGEAARRIDPRRVAEEYLRAGVDVLVPGGPGYPSPLLGDPGAPAVLFARGDTAVLEGRRRVAIVGARSATPYGRQVASELGHQLADAGVVVVSGLARGIDGAAHAGAVHATGEDRGRPVGVVGTGVDVVYPASNRVLWEQVAADGVVLSESPLGTVARPRVFPARNRIIAALADVVVVVESHHGGGALTTAEAAARRGIPVGAVPGSVKSRASEGTNGLLVDGCIPVRDATDVLVAVSLAPTGRMAPAPVPEAASLVAARGRDRPGTTDHRPHDSERRTAGRANPPEGSPDRAVLEAVEDAPTTFETILLRTGLAIPEAVDACHRLVAEGRLRSGAGWWSKE